MGTAILITGFNSWGKTTLIYELFQRRRFVLTQTYQINTVNAQFVVESHSNDDYTEANYIARLQQRMHQAPGSNNNLLCAFCPTREPNNDSMRILRHNVFSQFNDIYLFLLEFKWDHHAELIIPNLQAFFQNSNINIVTINAGRSIQGDQQRIAAKAQQVVHELNIIF